ncbi:hypothetical protein CTT39_22140 [Agrobacterium rosae]|nr:hypothetical protein CTT39_22140 [Agrobacterium rosae]
MARSAFAAVIPPAFATLGTDQAYPARAPACIQLCPNSRLVPGICADEDDLLLSVTHWTEALRQADPTKAPLNGAIGAHYKNARASSKLGKVSIGGYLNREVVIVMVDVPHMTAVHADDWLVEPRRPNEMREVDDVAAEGEALADTRAGGGEVHYLRFEI